MAVRITHFDSGESGSAVFLGSSEAQIMELTWKHGPMTVKRALFLLPAELKLAYTTVMTIMYRLAEKGLLEREKQGRNYVYRPAVSRDEFLRERVLTVYKNLKRNFRSYLE